MKRGHRSSFDRLSIGIACINAVDKRTKIRKNIMEKRTKIRKKLWKNGQNE